MPRRTAWVDTIVDENAATAGQATKSLLGILGQVDTRGTTLIRTIVSLGLWSNTTAGAWGVQRCDIGIGITSQEAFSAGAFPDPKAATDEPPRGWVYRTSKLVTQNGVGTQIVFEVMADIRGARKIENGELFLIMDNTAESGTTFTVNLQGLVRILYKLA